MTEKRTTIFEETTQNHQLYDIQLLIEMVETPLDAHSMARFITHKDFRIKLTGRMFGAAEISLTAVLKPEKVVKLMEALDQHLSKAEKA